ncbi:sensor histidine kinase [Paenibacillus sepulcri]|uniref:Sensor histidine kinase n=1 Tax=Paenibacillus sepulcri TaxID=359917 RepID=A0ABS7BXC1_9BACL|nr:sensor histidine kinase [Paenibacillus sepulcri]
MRGHKSRRIQERASGGSGLNLKYKVSLSFCLFIIGPFLVVGWISAFHASDTMKDEVGKTMLQLVRQNHVTMEKTVSTVNDTTITFLNNHYFSNSKQFAFWSGIETLSQISEADTILERLSSDGTEYMLYMKNTANRRAAIDTSYKTRGFRYTDDVYSGLPSWAKQTEQDGGKGSVRLIEAANGLTTVAYMRSILDPVKYDKSIGLLVVSRLEVLLMQDIVTVQLPENTGIYLLNEQDELLMKVGQEDQAVEDFPSELKERTEGYRLVKEGSGEWLYAFSHRPQFNTRLIYKIPAGSITGNQTAFQWVIMTMSAVYLLFVLIFVLYLLRVILKPLAKLISITKIYEPGKKLNIGMDPPRADEFGILYGSFMKMTRRLDQSFEENVVMKMKQKEMELSTLHSQITPHLLYNTLDSIYWYAVDSGNRDVGDMVKDLSKLLRIGLSKGKSLITIAEELEHVQAYTRLQMKRYPGTFEVNWDIEESVTSFMTPKLVLQPLVENAIFHGVSSMDGEGTIWIRIKRAGEEIHMTVEDNGFIGGDIQMFERIVRGESEDKGFGIRNVQQRIQLHFGESYGLRYASREGGGITVIINIPVWCAAKANTRESS